MDDSDVIEQTLHIAREVKVFTVPPRSATGHRSGEWKVSDQIFCGRMRVMAIGEMLEVRFEDPNTGELFAKSPIPPDKKDAYVEPTADSSRYFVIRVEDPATKRHAFLGMGFDQRSDAFDFNVALSDHVRHLRRETAVQKAAEAGEDPSALELASEDAKVLYQPHQDRSLKEGQTIHVSVKTGGGSSSSGGGLVSSAKAAGVLPAFGSGFKLAPPPAPSSANNRAGTLLPPPPIPAPSAAAPAPAAHQQNPPSQANDTWDAFSAPEEEGGWAKFD